MRLFLHEVWAILVLQFLLSLSLLLLNVWCPLHFNPEQWIILMCCGMRSFIFCPVGGLTLTVRDAIGPTGHHNRGTDADQLLLTLLYPRAEIIGELIDCIEFITEILHKKKHVWQTYTHTQSQALYTCPLLLYVHHWESAFCHVWGFNSSFNF